MKKVRKIRKGFIFSCIEVNKERAYYNFKEEDYEKVLNFEKGQSITFQNNLGEITDYKVTRVVNNTKVNANTTNGTLRDFEIPLPFNDPVSFQYDYQITDFNEIDTPFGFKYGFIRLPKDLYQAQKNQYDDYPSQFIGQIYFIKWNSFDNSWVINIDFNATTSSMTFYGITYKNVYTIETGNPNIGSCYFSEVNKVYYDLHAGIIGYDTIDGTQWRLTN